MKKKLLLLTVIFALVLLLRFDFAYAVLQRVSEGGSNGGSSKINQNTGSTSGTSCGTNSPWYLKYSNQEIAGGNYISGMRITIYDKDGTKVSDSVDFYFESQAVRLDKNATTTSLGRFSKIDYIQNGTKVSFGNNATNRISGIVHPYDFSNCLVNCDNENIFVNALGLGTTKEQFLSKFSQYDNLFFPGNGLSFEYILNQLHASDYYMIVEPASIIECCGVGDKFVTYYELQQFSMGNYDGGFMNRCKAPSVSSDNNVWNPNEILANSSFLYDNGLVGHNNDTMSNILKELRDNNKMNDQKNRYGIAVKWFGEYTDIPNNSCTSSTEGYYNDTDTGKTGCCSYGKVYNYNTHSCETPSPTPDPDPEPDPEVQNNEFKCEAYCKANSCGNVVDCSYTNCPYLEDGNPLRKQYTIKYSEDEEKDVTVCGVTCDERYFIKSRFISLKSSTHVAGTYFPVYLPETFHKKNCSYKKLSDSKIQSYINKTKSTEISQCPPVDCDENGVCDSSLHDACVQDAEREAEQSLRDITQSCNNIKRNYDNKKTRINETANDDMQGNITLKLTDFNSSYTLVPTKVRTQIGTFNGNTYDYGYHNTFSYAIKENTGNQISTNQNNDIYIDLKESTMTTPITAKTGKYYFNVNYSNLFSTDFKNVMNDYGHVNVENDSKINGSDSSDDTQCSYDLTARNIKDVCVPKAENNYCQNTIERSSLKIVYRQIDLKNPFPGKSGNGRTPGKNWSSANIKRYITNNRNANYNPENTTNDYDPESIYSRTPLYVIKLDPKNISEIKSYNKDHAYDDFTLECTAGTGRECISSFLKSYLVSGTCANATKDTFYSCVYD